MEKEPALLYLKNNQFDDFHFFPPIIPEEATIPMEHSKNCMPPMPCPAPSEDSLRTWQSVSAPFLGKAAFEPSQHQGAQVHKIL